MHDCVCKWYLFVANWSELFFVDEMAINGNDGIWGLKMAKMKTVCTYAAWVNVNENVSGG